MLSASRVRELLDYDAETGEFKWKVNRCNVKAGAIAGSIGSEGRWMIKINRRSYKAHRLAWLYVHGDWPKNMIDHIDGDVLNNRISNLRDVTMTVNAQNRRRPHRKNTSSGLLGVTLDKRSGKFYAQIGIAGKKKFLGSFDSAEVAHRAYLEAKRQLHIGCTI